MKEEHHNALSRLNGKFEEHRKLPADGIPPNPAIHDLFEAVHYLIKAQIGE